MAAERDKKALGACCADCGMPLPRPDAACPACGKRRAGEGAAPCLDVYDRYGEDAPSGSALARGVGAVLEGCAEADAADGLGALAVGLLDALTD